MRRSRLFETLLLGIALLVPSYRTFCTECCPKASIQASISSASGCCGQCTPTLERSSDSSCLTVKAVRTEPTLAAVLPLPIGLLSIERIATHRWLVLGYGRFAPPSSPAPLRL